MQRINKALLGLIIGGVLGLLLATVGFWSTILILFLMVLGYLIGGYLEAQKEKKE
ncbi:MAG: DUF2273 domain-containing protein [candidate division WOR-3 bacterium]|nr:MAG: DUF2273 domain-containing protein [candidate division WOR-3 bacterium]